MAFEKVASLIPSNLKISPAGQALPSGNILVSRVVKLKTPLLSAVYVTIFVCCLSATRNPGLGWKFFFLHHSSPHCPSQCWARCCEDENQKLKTWAGDFWQLNLKLNQVTVGNHLELHLPFPGCQATEFCQYFTLSHSQLFTLSNCHWVLTLFAFLLLTSRSFWER